MAFFFLFHNDRNKITAPKVERLFFSIKGWLLFEAVGDLGADNLLVLGSRDDTFGVGFHF